MSSYYDLKNLMEFNTHDCILFVVILFIVDPCQFYYQYNHNYTAQKPEIYKIPGIYPHHQVDVQRAEFLYHLMMYQRGAGPHIQQQIEVQRPGIYLYPTYDSSRRIQN